MVEKWWRDHHGNDFRKGFPALQSFIVQNDGKDAVFFGIAPMTPDFCYLAFPLVNPSLAKDKRDTAIDFMLECAKIAAQRMGFPVLWISIRGEKMLNRLGRAGFIEAESGNTHMFCKVGEIA